MESRDVKYFDARIRGVKTRCVKCDERSRDISSRRIKNVRSRYVRCRKRNRDSWSRAVKSHGLKSQSPVRSRRMNFHEKKNKNNDRRSRDMKYLDIKSDDAKCHKIFATREVVTPRKKSRSDKL